MKKLPHDPVIVAFARSPIGKYNGILRDQRPDQMLATVMAEALKRSGIDKSDVSDVIAGCANQAGEDNRNIARMASLLARFPLSTSAITLNRLCASGLDAVIDGARMIALGETPLVVVGGVESMTRSPLVMAKSSSPFKIGAPVIYDSSLGWRFFNEDMRSITLPEANGVTAERLADMFKISRARQDQFALRSHELALYAYEDGLITNEIIPWPIEKNGEIMMIDRDEGPREDTNLQKLSKLKASFTQEGSVTAGNSSPLSDGAASIILCAHEYAKAHGLKPLARIVDYKAVGIDPKIMGLGPVPATRKLLENMNIGIDSFDAIEINEAFAAQVLAVIESLTIDEEKVNTHGGAIALGHPLGCSGVRIVIALINRLRATKKHLGLATLCVGVGQGVSMAIEAV